MIEYRTGSIFESSVQCLVNPVNCVGVMGKGLALEFKRQYPDMYKKYRELCLDGSLGVGQVAFYSLKRQPNKIICLFPTKNHWRDKSTVSLIDGSLQAFVKYAPEMKIKTAAFPKIGCGYGGLNFELQIRPMLEQYFSNSSFNIEVYV